MSVSATFGDKAGAATRSGRGLDDLFAEHAPQAGKLAYLLTGDRYLAEDIVQEAFVKLTGRFDHIRNRDAFPSYLRQTIVNLARVISGGKVWSAGISIGTVATTSTMPSRISREGVH